MSAPEDLVEKLIAVEAVERTDGELRFTEKLCHYLASSNPDNISEPVGSRAGAYC